MARRALLTGIGGQDGSYLAELLLEHGYEVFGTALASPEGLPGELEVFRLDLTDGDAVRASIRRIRPDETYHLASASFVPASWEDPVGTSSFAAAAAAALLDALRLERPEGRFLNAASAEIFGAPEHTPQTLATPVAPITPYGAGKAFAHFLTGAFRRQYGLHASSAILYNHESPRRSDQFLTRKVSRGAAAISLGLERELLLGDLSAIRDWGFAGDYVRAMWLTLQADEPGDEVIATGEAHTVEEFVAAAFAHVGLDWREYVRYDESLSRGSADSPALVGDPYARERTARLEGRGSLRRARPDACRRRRRAARGPGSREPTVSRAMRWTAGLAAGASAVALAVPSDAAVSKLAGSPPGTYRGVIEGFYGPPWFHADRLSMVRWLGRHGLDTYVYAPKDDPYQRQAWRELYPAEEAARLRELVVTARRSKVRVVYSISPGLDMCYSSPGERASLLRKLEQLRALGVRTLMLAFDDIPREFHCVDDGATYGTGDPALGRAHAEVANAVFRWNPGERLIVVPSDYAELARTPYLGALTGPLASGIDIAWTGPFVVPSRITVAHAAAIARVYGRLPVLWDNYPVNDFARDDLHLGPVAGRAPGLPRRLAGYLSNPMNEPWASRVPLHTVAAYLRSPVTYRPDVAWRAAVRELGGRRGAGVLGRLADNSQSSSTLDDPRTIWPRESTILWPKALDAARSLRGPELARPGGVGRSPPPSGVEDAPRAPAGRRARRGRGARPLGPGAGGE